MQKKNFVVVVPLSIGNGEYEDSSPDKNLAIGIITPGKLRPDMSSSPERKCRDPPSSHRHLANYKVYMQE
jgi:hypothetical protein